MNNNAPKGRILVVDDNEDVLLSLNMLLKPVVEAVRVTSTPERIIEFIDSFHPDVIMLDMNFRRDAISGEEGYEWLSRILEHDPRSVVLFITAYVDTEKAVRAIKAGAVDFIPKPWDRRKLLDTVKSAVELRRSRTIEGDLSEMEISLPNLIGECDDMRQLKEQITRVAATDANVLITGENGAGKDVVAHAIHQFSHRSDKPFVSIDLGCIPESLFESELFGYEKGAFTDARNTKEGRVEQANGGTLFLDEIGNLSLQMQQKLLTVIEKKETSRIGSSKTKKVNLRIVSATNANLAARISEGTFRQDLFYRINTIELHIPPLRERGDDIILLAEHFLDIFAMRYDRKGVGLSDDARIKLLKHSWPGNVRELQHCIERSLVLSDSPALSASDIQISSGLQSPNNGETSDAKMPLNLEELERNAIKRAVSMSNGNLTQAAELLGITRFALYRKIDKLGI
ncbi:MAG: sigma-54 dependent transcriptional regulator [Prevotella sp.]|nr:sigma-54 dependent transcriptional regulator [Prevotella sp.]